MVSFAMWPKFKNLLVFFWLLLGTLPIILAQKSDSDEIFIDLSNAQPGTVLTEFYNITQSKNSINILNINETVSFFLIQIHTFNENVTLSYNEAMDLHSYTTGTNIGLIWNPELLKTIKFNSSQFATFYLLRNEKTYDNLRLLLVISTYSKNDPVPGGCNLSFETEIAPYQKVNLTQETITISSQPPSIFGEFCNRSEIVTEMYYLYLSQFANSSDEYFSGLQKMVSPQNISAYGTKVPSGLTWNKFKHIYNAYRGTGRVFAVVSTYKGHSSTYVPIVSYGCDLNAWEDECLGPGGAHWKLMIALLLICGLFLCFAGHRFFRTGLFIVAYIFGVLLMLIVVTIDNDFTEEGKTIYGFIMGVFVSITWLFLWWKFGTPVITVQLTFLLSGFILASILFYSQIGDLYLFSYDGTFYACFFTVLIISLIPIVSLKPLPYIVAISLIGSYSFIVAMNYYVGGNLPYIFINTYRRITVKNFGMVIISPPYEMIDAWQTVFWILIFGVGIYVQHKRSLGKPPFPPHRRGLEFEILNERTPLLSN